MPAPHLAAGLMHHVFHLEKVMTAPQAPLGTPFSSSSTASDVLDGLDLTGKEVIVTGGHSRLGREVSRALAAAGAAVTVAARDPQRAAAAVAEIAGLRVEQLDLTDPGSVEAFAQRWLISGRPVHVLINNAAAMFPPELRRDARGHELSFSTSHLGHFQLTRALLPALSAARGARVVNVTSGAARVGEIRWDDLDFATGYDPPPLTASQSAPTSCSPSSSTVGTPIRASGPSPHTLASSSAPAPSPRRRWLCTERKG